VCLISSFSSAYSFMFDNRGVREVVISSGICLYGLLIRSVDTVRAVLWLKRLEFSG
jgi:hypothetical protein